MLSLCCVKRALSEAKHGEAIVELPVVCTVPGRARTRLCSVGAHCSPPRCGRRDEDGCLHDKDLLLQVAIEKDRFFVEMVHFRPSYLPRMVTYCHSCASLAHVRLIACIDVWIEMIWRIYSACIGARTTRI